MDIKGLFVWILGSVIRVIQLISTLKKLFVSYFSITWIMTHWTQGNIFLVSISFTYTSQNWVTMGLRASTSDKNPKSIYVIKREWFAWMAAPISYSMAWSVGSPKFICLCINFLHYLNQRISDTFFQIKNP